MQSLIPGRRYQVYIQAYYVTGWFEADFLELAPGGGDGGTAIFSNGVHLAEWGHQEVDAEGDIEMHGWYAVQAVTAEIAGR